MWGDRIGGAFEALIFQRHIEIFTYEVVFATKIIQWQVWIKRENLTIVEAA